MLQYIVFDTETTGLPKNYKLSAKLFNQWPHIVQFSWIICKNNKKEEKSFIIKPDNYNIPEESTKIHNITTDFANKHGYLLKDVLSIFKNDCDQVDYIVAHNSNFDKKVILAAYYRNNIDATFLENKKIVCTMLSTIDLCKLQGKYGYKYPKLEELFIFLFNKKPNVQLHNSLEDSRITLQCYQKLIELNIKMV